MQIKVETLSSIKKKINFEIPAERVSDEITKAYTEIRKHAAIKGFRKGKVPMELIEKTYSEKMAEDVLKTLVNDTYFQAVNDEGISPVSFPLIESDTLTPGQPFKYSATVEVYPAVELKEYQGLEVKKEKLVVDEAVIDARLKEMQNSLAQLVPAAEGHKAATGDFVVFDFKGFMDGVPFEGGEAEDFQLELGSGRFIPGFEEQMVGLAAGDTADLTVNFPENYGASHLAGKPATFSITVKEIKVKELPELNDEFAKGFGEEFETLDQLKERLKEVHETQERQRVENELKDRVVQSLIEKNDLEVPEAMVDRHVANMLENTKKRLASQHMSLEQVGLTEESYKSQFRESARTQVKGSLLLEAVAEKEGVQVTEADIEAKAEEIAGHTKKEAAYFKNLYLTNPRAKENLIAQMREEKALELLLEKAKVEEVAKEEI
ncbi:trigger factor [Geomonas sp. RF6]|uniref:trigger factor n=1 Tax=Geomonas sp. RF6 TaxID=2897342 RepID=UPI001E5FA0E0|nr:trigger factor [Geomonas sp. RF6]UFS70882.1 trigger factor [Geomonas sp. RF6]